MPASFDVNSVAGNASPETKTRIGLMPLGFMLEGGKGFANSVGINIKVTEVSTRKKDLAPTREEALVVCEMEVTQDMVNGGGNMHGGCSAYLIDVCTSLPVAVIAGHAGVSQAINMIYHAPAPLGTHLRIVSTTITIGGRAMSARGEIWDTKHDRLIASGVHVKMAPSSPKL